MHIKHSAVKSSIYELVKVVEVDLQFGEDFCPTRIEIFKDTERPDHFRCRAWEMEFFRLTPTFPQGNNSEPLHISDDILAVQRDLPHTEIDHDDFVASNAEEALKFFIQGLTKYVEHTTGEEAGE
jgi:hypothetical protein